MLLSPIDFSILSSPRMPCSYSVMLSIILEGAINIEVLERWTQILLDGGIPGIFLGEELLLRMLGRSR